MKTALTIAGSDCSGGAGIQADIKTFSAHGVYGMSVITSVVAENTCRVTDYQDITPDMVKKQADDVFEDIPPDAVKVGMLSCAATMLTVADRLKFHKARNVVIDPVMYAKNGSALMNPTAIDTLIREIVPLADIITPNIPEAGKMTGKQIENDEDIRNAALAIYGMGCRAVVIKGGHRTDIKGEQSAVDILFDGKKFHTFPGTRIDTKHTHGTGCTFSSAIASNLALGFDFHEAVRRAKEYIKAAIANAPKLGKGNGPVNHLIVD
ncbi:MAG: bifunctional hydroxymethylpyrimidine kinase/phosphomethylpyrimidine kinase [Oscillospiraceae bacterium]|nr:bifunctional hydroxymethylpyrimidine kinase/phosphomethylpyrimidine kinase [Oscillospiraceae bacterium]